MTNLRAAVVSNKWEYLQPADLLRDCCAVLERVPLQFQVRFQDKGNHPYQVDIKFSGTYFGHFFGEM